MKTTYPTYSFAVLCYLAFASLLIGTRGSLNAEVIYSPNVCGWYQVTIPAGKTKIVANQLVNPQNTVAELFGALSARSVVSIQNTDKNSSGYGTYITAVKRPDGTAWLTNGNMPLPVGTAAIVDNYGNSDATITFTGTIPIGPTERLFEPLIDWVFASLTPIAVTTPLDMGYTMQRRDIFNKLNVETGAYTGFSVNALGMWTSGRVPFYEIGEGFIYQSAAPYVWTQSLSTDITTLLIQ